MEYLAGALVTLATIYVVVKMSSRNISDGIRLNMNHSQSRFHEITKYSMPFKQKVSPSQSSNHYEEKFIRICYMDGLVYWIEDNAVYSAAHEHGKILKNTKKAVDTTSMNKVELDKMIFIVNKLTEGLTNDSGNSGN
jgi:hypothetical protein